MSEPLQEYGWKKSNYDHPEKGWTCGRLCEGTPCQFGPNSKGSCEVKSQCVPVKKGDRYECTRLPVHGGKCKESPLPDGSCCQSDLSCQPVRTLPSIRHKIGVIVFGVSLVFCLLIFSGSSPSLYVSPGELSHAHSSIDRKCSQCHSAGDGGLTHWIATAMDSTSPNEDSQRCMKCHQELGSSAMTAHGVDPQLLEKMKTETDSTGLQKTSSTLLRLSNKLSNTKKNEELACSTCHREHHGRNADITKLTDLQCQACHQKQFKSFSHGHPELEYYPYMKRTGIYFDHSSHYFQHFANDEFKRTMPEGVKPESCNACHVQDLSGKQFLTKGFEESCASCHESQIVDKEFSGIPFIALPAIDSELFITKQENGNESLIGEWPNQNRFSTTTELPPLMNLLLDQSKQSQDGTQLNLQEIYSADTRNKKKISLLAWKIKKLFAGTSRKTIHKDEEKNNPYLEKLLGLNPSLVPTLNQAQKIWFPNLNRELKLIENGKAILIDSAATQKNGGQKDSYQDPSTGWSISFTDYTIRYRPIQHEDPLLKKLLDNMVKEMSREPGKSESFPHDLEEMFQILANPNSSGSDELKGPIASGSCLKCHTINQNDQGEYRINWKTNTNIRKVESLTTFSHQPHLVSIEKENCRTCHHLDEGKELDFDLFRKEFLKRDPSGLNWLHETNPSQPLSSGFMKMSKASCMVCHNNTEVNQSCLQCHQYHFHRKKIIDENRPLK